MVKVSIFLTSFVRLCFKTPDSRLRLVFQCKIRIVDSRNVKTKGKLVTCKALKALVRVCE